MIIVNKNSLYMSRNYLLQWLNKKRNCLTGPDLQNELLIHHIMVLSASYYNRNQTCEGKLNTFPNYVRYMKERTTIKWKRLNFAFRSILQSTCISMQLTTYMWVQFFGETMHIASQGQAAMLTLKCLCEGWWMRGQFDTVL